MAAAASVVAQVGSGRWEAEKGASGVAKATKVVRTGCYHSIRRNRSREQQAAST